MAMSASACSPVTITTVTTDDIAANATRGTAGADSTRATRTRGAGSSSLRALLAKPMSRRLFLSVSAVVGALTFKGSALGGTLQAWADESGQEHFVVYLLSKYEVPIMVYDVSGATPTPLAGCSVTVNSWYTETSKTAVTDESGFAPLNVKELSFQKDDDTAQVYNFWGSIAAEKDGYRQFYEDNCWIEAGTPTAEDGSRPNTIEIPTQPDNGTPYLRSFALDGADIQYIRGVSAYLRSSNTADHDIVLQVAAGKAGAQVQATLLVNGTAQKTATSTSTQTSPYLAELTFTDKWLSLLNPEDQLSVQFGIQGETAYAFASPLVFEDSLLLNDEGQAENQMISPGLEANADPEERAYAMPAWMGREGDSLYFSFPFMPVQLFYEDGGRFGIVATLLRIDWMKRRDGVDLFAGKDRVNSFWGLSGKSAWDLFNRENQRWIDNLSDAYGRGETAPEGATTKAFGCSKFTKDIGIRFALSAMGYGDVRRGAETDTLYTELDLGMKAEFSVTFACTKHIVICYVPTCWSFDVSASAKAQVLFGMAFENCFENIDWAHHAPDGEGGPKSVVALHAEAGLSVGLGIAGVCSLSIRGYGFINVDFVFDQDKEKSKPYPQICASLGCGAQVIAQFLFFKVTETVASLDDMVLYDNTKKSASLPQGASQGLAGSIAQLPPLTSIPTEKMQLVTDLHLKKRIEITGRWESEGKRQTPRFESVPMVEGASTKRRAGVYNPFHLKQTEQDEGSAGGEQDGQSEQGAPSRQGGRGALSYSPINGLKPTVEELLWEGCYSNPRMRIVHTSEDGFDDDRCFMVRLAVVDVEVPASTSAFASGAFFGDATTDADGSNRTGARMAQKASKLTAILDEQGNYKVVPVAEPASEQAPAEGDATGEAGGNGGGTAESAAATAGTPAATAGESVAPVATVAQHAATTAAASTATITAESVTVPRTRLLISEWDRDEMVWGSAEVVDFIAEGEVYESDRLNAYDVDFDIDALDDGTLLLAITSLSRPDGSTTQQPIDYEKNQYISLIRWDHDARKAIAAGSTRSINTTGRSLFHPRIMRQFFDDGSDNAGQRCLVYSYVCAYDSLGRTSCNFAVTVFDKMEGETGTGISGQHRLTPPIDVFPSDVNVQPDVLVTGTFEVACPDRAFSVWDSESNREQSAVVISWSRPKSDDMEALSFVLSETFSVVTQGSGNTAQHRPYVNLKGNLLLSKIPHIAKLSSRNQQGLFSYADMATAGDTKPLRMVTYNKSDCTLDTIEDTGETDKTQYFSSFNGRRLYTVRVMEGSNPGLSETAATAVQNGATLESVSGPFNSPQASSSTQESQNVALYQLLEARWVDELQTYYDFYPIAQLTHIPDNIGVIAANDTRTDFTFVTISDIDNNQADLYQVAVPKVMAATCDNASPVSPFAAPGDTCWYTIDVTNVGNAPITLIAMNVYDSNGNVISTTTYDDLSPYAQASADSVRGVYDRNGQLVVDENGCASYTQSEDARDTAGILWPGKCRTYQFGFTVPEGATGNAEFGVGIAAVEDHLDDESAPERLSTFREAITSQDDSSQPAQKVPLIRPFVKKGQGNRLNGAETDSEEASSGHADGNLGSQRSEIVYDGGTLFDVVRHKINLLIANSRVDTAASASHGSAHYSTIGPDGEVIDPNTPDADGTGGAGGSDASGTGGGSSANGNPAGGNKSHELSPTGDAASASIKTTLAGTLLGAAALGVAAYEKRRAENESQG